MKYVESFENYNTNYYKLRKFINKVKTASKFAEDAHKDQKRKGGDPYFIHPDAVAKIVHEVKKSDHIAHLIAAAYLHDVVEDTDYSIEQIRHVFGEIVGGLVDELTSDKEKIEISGKEEYLIDKMIGMTSWALVIKLADRLHNLSDFKDIMNGDDEKRKKWAKKYAEQTRSIMDEIEWYRDLSDTQLNLVNKIRHKLNVALETH